MVSVSVIIPTYNRSSIVTRSIDSVLDQSYEDFELLVVDDGSPDDTEAVVRGYEDDRVQYHALEQNTGVYAARNEGIRQASGDYIALLDDDDAWNTSKLERQVERFNELSPEYGMVYTGRRIHTSGDTERDYPTREGNIFEALLQKNSIPIETVLIRANCFDEVGTFDGKAKSSQDWDMWLRIAKKYKIAYVDDLLAECYREHTGRLSDKDERRFQGHKRILDKYREELEDNPIALSRLYDRLGFEALYVDHDQSSTYFKRAFLLETSNYPLLIYYIISLLPKPFRGIAPFLRYRVP